jgi:hypothetical protein
VDNIKVHHFPGPRIKVTTSPFTANFTQDVQESDQDNQTIHKYQQMYLATISLLHVSQKLKETGGFSSHRG